MRRKKLKACLNMHENLEDLNSEEKLRRRKFAEANSYYLKIEEIENLLAMP
ncbi:MAG: hypothetical protein IPF63_10690 [Bacteroidetes bacterium]|nr:hypothetical protein [Bacteroidota bacterium]